MSKAEEEAVAVFYGRRSNAAHHFPVVAQPIGVWETCPRHPFSWTKTADDVLSKINREKTSTANH